MVLATALGRQSSGPRVALLYRLPRGVGSGLQWPRPPTRRHRLRGKPLWRAPPTVRSHQPGSGKLWGTWALIGGNLAAHGSERDSTSGGKQGFTCYLEANCERTLDEVRKWMVALVVRGDGDTVRSRGK